MYISIYVYIYVYLVHIAMYVCPSFPLLCPSSLPSGPLPPSHPHSQTGKFLPVVALQPQLHPQP